MDARYPSDFTFRSFNCQLQPFRAPFNKAAFSDLTLFPLPEMTFQAFINVLFIATTYIIIGTAVSSPALLTSSVLFDHAPKYVL